MDDWLEYVAPPLIGLWIVGGIVSWARGILYLRDCDPTQSPNSPREIWFIAIRGPYKIISGLAFASLYFFGVIGAALCVFGLAFSSAPDWLYNNADELMKPVFGRDREQDKLAASRDDDQHPHDSTPSS